MCEAVVRGRNYSSENQHNTMRPLTETYSRNSPLNVNLSVCRADGLYGILEASLEHDLVLLSHMKGKPLRRVHNQMESACIVWKNRKQIDPRLSANTRRQFGKFCESRL